MEASTTCTTVVLYCNTMVSYFSYPEIHFSRKRQKGEEMGSSDKKIFERDTYLGLWTVNEQNDTMANNLQKR